MDLNTLIGYVKAVEGSIDQTMLKVNASEREYLEFIERSEKYSFRAVVVPQVILPLVTPLTKYRVGTVIGFPNGYSPVDIKLREIDYAATCGAREVDVVLNLIPIKSGKWSEVSREVSELVKRSHELGLIIKIIIETSGLTHEEVRSVSKLVELSGADFIKTNTGFGSRGVLPSDILTIKSATSGKIKIKASGGIRTAIDAALMLYLGAHVIGTSYGVEIAEEARKMLAT